MWKDERESVFFAIIRGIWLAALVIAASIACHADAISYEQNYYLHWVEQNSSHLRISAFNIHVNGVEKAIILVGEYHGLDQPYVNELAKHFPYRGLEGVHAGDGLPYRVGEFGSYIYRALNFFSGLTSRGETVMTGLGMKHSFYENSLAVYGSGDVLFETTRLGKLTRDGQSAPPNDGTGVLMKNVATMRRFVDGSQWHYQEIAVLRNFREKIKGLTVNIEYGELAKWKSRCPKCDEFYGLRNWRMANNIYAFFKAFPDQNVLLVNCGADHVEPVKNLLQDGAFGQ